MTILQTCLEMISQRGYILETTTVDVITAIKPLGEKICFFIKPVQKFNVLKLKEFIAIMSDLNVCHSVIIYKDKITSKTKKIIDDLTDITIEIFTDIELSYNITKSKYVPLHERLSKHEAKQFKDTYGIKLSVIRHTDSIARFYGFLKGDVIQITQPNEIVVFSIVK